MGDTATTSKAVTSAHVPRTVEVVVASATKSAPRRRLEEQFRHSAFLVLLLFIPLFLSLKPDVVGDSDVWWHLRTGQWIAQHHALPATDPFSAFGAGKPWIAYSWIFELALYACFRSLGLAGIVYFQVALSFAITCALLALVRRVQTTPWKSFALSSLALLAMIPMFAPRPWLFTILFMTLELHILLKARETGRPRPLWLLPPLFVLWANIHVQFVYGLLVLGFVAIEPWAAHLLSRTGAKIFAPLPAKRVWLILAACLAATLVSPYHVRIYKVILDLGAQSRALTLVSEFHAPLFRNIADYLVLAIAMAAVFALAWRRDLNPFNLLLLAASAAISFRMARDVWFVVIVAIAIISSSDTRELVRFSPSKRQWLGIAAAVMVLALVTARSRHLSSRELQGVVDRNYPVNAAKYVADHQLAGPLYNDFDWGGYLIWGLPALPVSMDGRTNVHGDERIERSYRTWMGNAGWATDQELGAAKVVIANLELPLTRELRRDPRFRLVYQDKVAAVFVSATQR